MRVFGAKTIPLAPLKKSAGNQTFGWRNIAVLNLANIAATFICKHMSQIEL
jgi:hypothetical protein